MATVSVADHKSVAFAPERVRCFLSTDLIELLPLRYHGFYLNMKRYSSIGASFFSAIFFLTIFFGLSEASAQSTPELFSGERRVFVTNGYSTTRHWPDILQRKLNRYFGGQQTIEVINSYKSGHPISKWIDLDTGEPLGPWGKEVVPALQSDPSVPTVLLAQQSLQWVFSDDRLEGIEDENDTARIEQGADAIQMYVEQGLEDGAEMVFMAMHIYKDSFEPIIGNERYALEAALNRGIAGFFGGPDVWVPTQEHFPLAFSKDEIHPNPIGDEIIAHYWFARLLTFDGKAVPQWSFDEMENAITGGGGEVGENDPPVADIQASPLSGTAPLTVTFDGSGSTDSDGLILAHDWTFPDGTNDATEIVDHLFPNPGTFVISLKVTDDIGDVDTAEVTITVTEEGTEDVFGDPSGDGSVTALDAAMVLSHVAGIDLLRGYAAISADVTNNGDISALDASLILQYVVGLIDCFPTDDGCSVN